MDEKQAPPCKTGSQCTTKCTECAEQEPVIDKSAAIRIATSLGWTPKREWQGLTDEERSELLDKYYFDDPSDAFMKEFEAKLKEKNT